MDGVSSREDLERDLAAARWAWREWANVANDKITELEECRDHAGELEGELTEAQERNRELVRILRAHGWEEAPP